MELAHFENIHFVYGFLAINKPTTDQTQNILIYSGSVKYPLNKLY